MFDKQPIQNKYLQPLNSPVDKTTNPQQKRVPWEWGVQQGVQLKKIRSSTAFFKKFTPGTLIGTMSGGTLVSSQINNGTVNNSLLQAGTQGGSLSGQGTYAMATTSGSAYIFTDSANNRIIGNDGTNARLVIQVS